MEPFPEADRQEFAKVARAIWEEVSAANGDIALANFKTLSDATD